MKTRLMCMAASALSLLVAADLASAQPPYVVRDLIVGSGTSSAGSDVDETVVLGAVAIFPARDGINGREMWRSDGTPAGTYLLMDIRPGGEDSLPANLVVHDGYVYFGADDGIRGRELWRTDGTTSGTTIVSDFRPGSAGSDAQPVSSAGGKLYFNAATTQGASPTLWVSDGTAAGSQQIALAAPCCMQDGTCVVISTTACGAAGGRWRTPGTPCEPGTCPQVAVLCCLPDLTCSVTANPAECMALGGTLAPIGQPCDDAAECLDTPVACCLPFGGCSNSTFGACLAKGGFPFLASQPCFDGCFAIVDPSRPRADTPVVELNGETVFGGPGFLWMIDGESLAVSPLATFTQATNPILLTTVGNRVFFAAQTVADGRELWVSDGTPGGTTMVANINPGPANGIDTDSPSAELIELNGIVYFQGSDGVNGRELWRSDGTAAGTWMVIDLHTQTSGSIPRQFTIFNNELYFFAHMPGSSDTLLRTDGTAGGTVVVKTGFSYAPNTVIVRGTRRVRDGLYYFSANTSAHARELWRTDGTTVGTILLRDEPGGGAATPGAMMAFADKMVYAADRPNSGRELWQTNGTPAGTVFFKDVCLAQPSFATTIRPGLGDVAFMMAPSAAYGLELFRTAGTAATTWVVKDIAPGPSNNTVIDEMVMFDGRLFFTATRSTPPAFSRALWSTDGTDAGTAPVGELAPAGGSGGVTEAGIAYGSLALFVGGSGMTGQELWTTDGTPAGTVMVKDIRPGTLSGMDLPNVFAQFGGFVYFGANDGSTGPELWRTDGTTDGTSLFADLTPGAGGGTVRSFFAFDDVLLFSYGNSLWRTDGTPGGTFTLNSGAGPSFPEEYFAFNGAVYFRGRQGSTDRELWRTDGTLAGTMRVKDINPGTADSSPNKFIVHAGELLFIASSPTGNDIWRTDGTEAGTTLALDLVNTTQPFELIEYGGQLYFTQTNSGRIWRTDLTAGGTVIFLSSGHSVPPAGFIEYSGILYFITAAGFPVTGGEIWRTDGTEPGTVVALDLVAGIGESNPGPLTLRADQFIFAAQTAANGRELWSFNPTTLAATRLTDIAGGSLSSDPTVFVRNGALVYFKAAHPTDGAALYRTDGSVAGTAIVVDPDIYRPVPSAANLIVVDDHLFFTDTAAAPDVLSATAGTAETTVQVRNFPGIGNIRSMVSFDGSLFLGANETGVGIELLRAEPVVNGTTLVADLKPGAAGSSLERAARVGNRLFFAALAGPDQDGLELCVSDGTTGGTSRVADVNAGGNGSNPRDFVDLNGVAIFVATTEAAGQEIWRSNGTAAGTYLLRDIKPGTGGSAPTGLTVLPGRVLFTADDGVHGRELWSTNGTTVGTMMLGDLWEGAGSSQPAWISRAPGRIFFTAYTPATGTELWTSNGSAFGTARVIDLVEGPSSAAVTGLTVAGSRLYFFATAAPSPTSLWAVEWNTAVGNICFADYDGSGGIGVPDIFGFLSDWFAMRPRADVDGDGLVAVPDIFAYLSLWFESCG